MAGQNRCDVSNDDLTVLVPWTANMLFALIHKGSRCKLALTDFTKSRIKFSFGAHKSTVYFSYTTLVTKSIRQSFVNLNISRTGTLLCSQ
jgi:hypothetical protein